MRNPVEKSLRNLPSIDKLLNAPELSDLLKCYGHVMVREAARDILGRLRKGLKAGDAVIEERLSQPGSFADLCAEIGNLVGERSGSSLIPVFNLTGTVIHTNLGRSVLPDQAVEAISIVARNPVNLEYDLAKGARGSRESHIVDLICNHTGAEAACVVNNNAAAVVLVLTSLAVGRDVLISRGELVEIGGSFRIPEVMGSAGCRLKEVGATNRTHRADYENAIDDQTALVMKVHTSNYEIQGFTKSVSEKDLAAIAHRHGLPFVVDLGSGTLVDLRQFGLPGEPTVAEVLQQGADLVTFSGDKLLGGPQAGIIAGNRELIELINNNPLKRALRIDKLTLAALSAVLRLYNDPHSLAQKLPILRDMIRPLEELREIAEELVPLMKERLKGIASVELISCMSQIGSGALPIDTLDSLAIALTPDFEERGDAIKAGDLARMFRRLPMPVLGRIHAGKLIFDLRCLQDVSAFSHQLLETDFETACTACFGSS